MTVRRRRPCIGGVALIAAIVGCGGGEGSTTPSPTPVSVASVSIRGAPTASVVVGDSLQLSASVLDAVGKIMSVAVSWTSSDATIATITTTGMVRAIGPGAATITASAGGRSASLSFTIYVGLTVDAAGSVLALPGGALALAVPPGTVTKATTFLFAPASNAAGAVRLIPGTAWELGPGGYWFGGNNPPMLSLRYDAAKLPAGVEEASLQLYRVDNNGAWTLAVSNTQVNMVTHVASAPVLNTGIYGLAATQVARVAISGLVAGGALYPGQHGQLADTAYDAAGNIQRGRTATWTSSDTRIASVDGTGVVTAVSAGDVTITATVDGTSGTTSVEVLPLVVADWSQATDWTTYHGTGAQNGYVPVTVDPTALHRRWTIQLSQNPMWLGAAAAGSAFAWTTSNGGNALLAAIDVQTGATKWSQFPHYATLNPPAYGGGAVYFLADLWGDSSFAIAFDANTGAQRWRTNYAFQWSKHTDAPVVAGGSLYAPLALGGLDAFDLASGRLLWHANGPQMDFWSPSVGNGAVYTYVAKWGTPAAVTAYDAATGNVLFQIADTAYRNDPNADYFTGAAALGEANDLLVIRENRVVSFDLAKRSIAWLVTSLNYNYTGGVTVANGVVYVNGGRSVEARRESDGALLWSWHNPNRDPTVNSVVTRNLLFTGDAVSTYAIDLASHRLVWSDSVSGALALSPQGVLLLSRSDGKLIGIAAR